MTTDGAQTDDVRELHSSDQEPHALERRPDAEPTAVIGWFLNYTDLNTVHPTVATDSDVWAVTRQDGDGVALALVDGDGDKNAGTLHRLGVHPDHRRKGIATALVDQLLEEYGALVARCRLTLPANDFYRDAGWELVDTEPAHPEDLNVWRIESSDN